MKTDRILSSRGLAFQRPVGFGLPRPRLSRRLKSPSLVLFVSQRRYLRAADRFARLSQPTTWGGLRAGVGV